MRLMTMVFAIAVTLPSVGWAFDENGYHSGMSLDEVRRSVAKRGTRLDLPSDLDAMGKQSFMEVSGPPSNLSFYGNFSFCHGKLFFYSEIFADSEFSTFLRLAERRTVELGQAQYAARTSETRKGPSYDFQLDWHGPGWTEWLDISQFNHQTVDINHSFRDDVTECN